MHDGLAVIRDRRFDKHRCMFEHAVLRIENEKSKGLSVGNDL